MDIVGSDEALTREQVAVILYGFATKYYSFDTGIGTALQLCYRWTVNDTAKSAMVGVRCWTIQWLSNGTIKPQTPVNRAVAATRLSRFIELNK